MHLKERFIRGFKEFMGMKQWPRNNMIHMTNRDEFLLAQLVRPGDVVFDVGANHGQVACFIASLCGVKGKVVAFEPVWRVYERMCERLQNEFLLRAPIITIPLGLSDNAQIVPIHYPESEWGDCLATIAPLENIGDKGVHAPLRTLKCGVITMDMFMDTTSIQHPNLVKIDVEGAECKVLAGGKSVFEHKQQPIIFIELVNPWLRRFGNSLWDAIGYLQSIGYTHYYVCQDGLVQYDASKDKPMPDAFRMGYNVISCVPAQHQWAMDNLSPFLAEKKPRLPPMDPPTMPNE